MKDQEFKIWCFFRVFWLVAAMIFVLAGCAGGALSTRELGALIGAGGGAGVGAIIGGATGHPGAGAAIGGALGLGAGALIGDQLQGQENKQENLDREIEAQKRKLEKLEKEFHDQRREVERLACLKTMKFNRELCTY